MMVSVPAMAPGSPPDTGASSATTPRSDRRAAIDCAAAGAMVLMSMWMWPALAPSATPSAPSVTCSTSGASATMLIVIDARRATSAALAQSPAPASSSGCIDSRRRLHTCTRWPALMRLRAMGRPMRPSPMNPTSIE